MDCPGHWAMRVEGVKNARAPSGGNENMPFYSVWGPYCSFPKGPPYMKSKKTQKTKQKRAKRWPGFQGKINVAYQKLAFDQGVVLGLPRSVLGLLGGGYQVCACNNLLTLGWTEQAGHRVVACHAVGQGMHGQNKPRIAPTSASPTHPQVHDRADGLSNVVWPRYAPPNHRTASHRRRTSGSWGLQ
jgi:hypothetical protein